MEVNEILDAIRHNKGRFAREATLAAIEKREEITPHLLRILEETIEQAHKLVEDPSYMAHMYALHLLAQFREGRAYPLVARLFSIPGKVVDDLAEDFLTEGLGPVLASVAHGDPSLIKGLVENREAYTWARVGALRAIPAMVGAQELPREAALAYFQELLRGKLEREPLKDVDAVWDALIHFAISLHPEEIYEDIEKAYERNLVNPGIVALEDVDRGLGRGKEKTLKDLPKAHPLITDTVEEMHWWACFEEDYKERQTQQRERRSLDVPEPLLPSARRDRQDDPVVQTIRRNVPKVGRNAPCPCGSGKKFKKCCSIKEHT